MSESPLEVVIPLDRPPETTAPTESSPASTVSSSDRPPYEAPQEEPTAADGKRRIKREHRPQSKTFDKVLTAFYKRPSEQLGKAILVDKYDKYRHESVVDIEEGDEGEEESRNTHPSPGSPKNSEHNRKSSDRDGKKSPSHTVSTSRTLNSPTHSTPARGGGGTGTGGPSSSKNHSYGHTPPPPLTSSPSTNKDRPGSPHHAYSNSTTVQSTIRDDSSHPSHRVRSKSADDDWDLYEHSQSQHAKAQEEEPVNCCLIS